MAFIDFTDAAPEALPVIPGRSAQDARRNQAVSALSDLEQRIVELARADGLETLRPQRKRSWLGRLILGPQPISPELANEQLEALRRLAVQAWHKGYTLPVSAVREAQAAGYSEAQVGAVIDTIGRMRAPFRRLAA
ncbi:hypothetical protein [Novosphingobium pentaromativorans]|uniref:Uncharacterized protein n=1 Tax=Novosphingobium pentaromativorans US6-1 TaxID=1088721 RepID=G6EG95_9SPHN|nr:hypothetical protein [Novosphingobium pentaromativorans]AIT82219.1 hypothetical protein JI59_22145 [Novosphingobium pentaromativorans US6-1]EHJ59784.1 hypothetical protein NSU_3366 [Novosphingobium pentaromativorans US6-1]